MKKYIEPECFESEIEFEEICLSFDNKDNTESLEFDDWEVI